MRVNGEGGEVVGVLPCNDEPLAGGVDGESSRLVNGGVLDFQEGEVAVGGDGVGGDAVMATIGDVEPSAGGVDVDSWREPSAGSIRKLVTVLVISPLTKANLPFGERAR